MLTAVQCAPRSYCALPPYRLLTLGFARRRAAAAAAAAPADEDAGVEADRMKNECAYLLKTHSITMLVIIGHEKQDRWR